MVEKLLHSIKKRFYDSHPELSLDPDVVQPGVYKWPPHFTLSLITIVFVGGCAGAYARYWVSQQFMTPTSSWPITTLFVNLLGAFLLGLLLEGLVRIGRDQGAVRLTRLALGTGFMGAFTTYSTFASDIYGLVQHNHIVLSVVYGLITVTGGLALSAFGIWVASSHHKRRERQT